MRLKITDLILQSYLPGAYELISWEHVGWDYHRYAAGYDSYHLHIVVWMTSSISSIRG